MIAKINRKLRSLQRRLNKASDIAQGAINYNFISHFKPLPPREMIINVTYWCNSRCIMCNIWKIKPKNELKLDDWKWAMKDPIFNTIRKLTISGGEPSMNRDLIKLTQLFVDSMPQLRNLGIITNGFTPELIINKIEQIAQICKKNSIHLSVSVSVDGINKIHEKVRRIPNAFQKSLATINGVQKLQKNYDISLGVGTMILRQNLQEYEATQKWFQDNKIPQNFQIVGFHDTFVANLNTQTDVDFKKKQNQQLFRILKKLSIPKSIRDFRAYYWKDMLNLYKHKKPRTTPCPFQKDQFVIDSFGKVYYCLSERPIGDFRDQKNTISDIYYDQKNLAFRQKMTKTSCLKCNSGCNVDSAISQDVKKYLWFRLTGQPWYGFKSLFS